MRIILLLLLVTATCSAQQTDLDFLIQKIKVNYPGYAEKTRNMDFDRFVDQALRENNTDTFRAMATIVDFFHDRHLDLFQASDSIDRQACNNSFREVMKYTSRGQYKRLEGFWLSEANHCVIAMIQVSERPVRYTAYVVECRDSSILYPGMAYYQLDSKTGNRFFTKCVSSRDRRSFYVWSKFRNDTLFTAGPYNKWRKLRHYSKPILPHLPIKNDMASGRKLSEKTFLITIPTSTARNGEVVDSLIKANKTALSLTKNLIIDIRNNTGGTVLAYTPLAPLLYTNPVLKVNSEIYGTADEATKIEKDVAAYIAGGGNDSAYIKGWLDFAKQERDSAGRFIPVPDDTLKLDAVLSHPENVGIVINYGCQSAAEIFLLEAMQSKKVRLFGEHTMGAIDYLDFYPLTSPSGRYKLYIATTRRKISEGGRRLDSTGIQPDTFIDDSNSNWVEVVKRYYENN